jgi:hypothetical protein
VVPFRYKLEREHEMAVQVSAPELARALESFGVPLVSEGDKVLTHQELAECLLVEVALNRLQSAREAAR